MIGRREVIAAAALMPLAPATAQACSIPFPLPKQKFDRKLQAMRVATVKRFMGRLKDASAEVSSDAEKETAGYVKPGFTLPTPAPYELESVAAFDDIVLLRAVAFHFTGNEECNPVVQVHGYYACHFDHRESDRIAMMDTIIYG